MQINKKNKIFIEVINKKIKEVHDNAIKAGWYSNLETGKRQTRNCGELIALCHTELSEAFEALRKNSNDSHLPHRKGVEVELADLIIRVFDMAGYMNLNIAEALIEKIAYNKIRSDHKIENRKKEGGKKF